VSRTFCRLELVWAPWPLHGSCCWAGLAALFVRNRPQVREGHIRFSVTMPTSRLVMGVMSVPAQALCLHGMIAGLFRNIVTLDIGGVS